MTTQHDLFPSESALEAPAATWSPCKLYRYTLRRSWMTPAKGMFGALWGTGRIITWILLNPSTADETQDDPTIRRCKEFSRSWQFDGLIIVNAYALRSTDPKGLWKVEDPNGPENDAAILGACHEASKIVCGWGKNLRNGRRDQLAKLLRDFELSALKRNADGSPVHPLYQPASLVPRLFRIGGSND